MSSDDVNTSESASTGDPPLREPWLTIPNLVSFARLIGSAFVIVLAWQGRESAFLVLVLVLLLSDWVDGKLARLLNQRTRRGAVIDGVIDKVLYAALLPAIWLLRPEFVERHWLLFLVAILAWLPSLIVSVVRFSRVPAYHTLLAKSCWLFTTAGLVLFFLDVATWPLIVALSIVVVAGLEATVIACVLSENRSDIPSLVHAVRERRGDH